jgi:hypothetical protein
MTLDEAATIVRRVELRNFPFPIRLNVSVSTKAPWPKVSRWRKPERLLVVSAEYDVPHRDTGAKVTVQFRAQLNERKVRKMRSVRAVMIAVRGFIVSMAEHEVDEALWCDGRRVFEPHEAPIDVVTDTLTIVSSLLAMMAAMHDMEKP